MSALTNHAENKIVDALLRGQELETPETLYIALSTGARADSGAPAEPEGNGYARVAMTANLCNFTSTQGTADVASTGTDGTVENAIPIIFPKSTGAWGEIKSVWFLDEAEGGNAWLSVDLTNTVLVSGKNFTLSFAVGELSFRIDD
jgi:hypothetical protein